MRSVQHVDYRKVGSAVALAVPLLVDRRQANTAAALAAVSAVAVGTVTATSGFVSVAIQAALVDAAAAT